MHLRICVLFRSALRELADDNAQFPYGFSRYIWPCSPDIDRNRRFCWGRRQIVARWMLGTYRYVRGNRENTVMKSTSEFLSWAKESFGNSRLLCVALAALGVIELTPSTSFACGCGCGVFEVGTLSMLPSREGGMVFAEYDFMNQNRNWSGASSARGRQPHKDIQTRAVTVGAQYMISRAWGMEVEVPYEWCRFTTTDADSGQIVSFNHWPLVT